ncbi:hypothetical protein ACJX0J_034415, partial [Zea mays]
TQPHNFVSWFLVIKKEDHPFPCPLEGACFCWHLVFDVPFFLGMGMGNALFLEDVWGAEGRLIHMFIKLFLFICLEQYFLYLCEFLCWCMDANMENLVFKQ